MGYNVKIQKVERPTNKSFYLSFPASVADSCEIVKGEEFEWLVQDRNMFVLKRKKKAKSFVRK